MKTFASLIFTLVCIACFPQSTFYIPMEAYESFQRVNRVRMEHGLHPLQVAPEKFWISTQNYATFMAIHEIFQHDKEGMHHELLAYEATDISENLALLYHNTEETETEISLYMNSKNGHRETMLYSHMTHMAVGVAYSSDGDVYYTHRFYRIE